MLSLFSLQEARTLFWYFLCLVHTCTSLVFEQKTQSPEAVSLSESATPFLADSESEEAWPLILLELLVTVSSSESTITLVGLEGG